MPARVRPTVDSKDFRLLAELNEDARQSLHALGRRVALSAPAVRERLRRLEAGGILQGYWVSIDPAVFGREDLLVSFAAEWTRADAVRALDAPDVSWAAWKVDGGLTVQAWPHDVKKEVTTLTRFLGREPTWHGVSRSGWTGKLSGLDWRILDALIDNPLAPIDDLGDATGLSPKTVRKHLAELASSEAIWVVARLGFLNDAGGLVYHLVVSGSAPFPELRRTLGEAVLIHETEEPRRTYIFCRADSLGELTARTHALGKLPGVTSVEVTLNREFLVGTKFQHALVGERIEAAERNRGRRILGTTRRSPAARTSTPAK